MARTPLACLAALVAAACSGDMRTDAEAAGPDAGAGNSGAEAPDAGAPGGDGILELSVPATAEWTDTGVDVAAGEVVELKASGTVSFRAGDEVGPDGYGPDEHDSWNALQCADHASLIGRVERSGAPFPIGSQGVIVAPRSGRLFLGPNDTRTIDNGGAFAVRISPSMPHDRLASHSVTVAGDAGWVDTGIDLAGDEIVSITASGEVDNNTRNEATCDPSGLPDTPNLNASILKCANHAALIGRIGAAGAPFLVSVGRSGPVPAAGRLFLAVNDSIVDDNAGKFAATVTLVRR